MPSHRNQTRAHQPHRIAARKAKADARAANVAELVERATSGGPGSQGAMSECVARGIHLPVQAKRNKRTKKVA